eukprot:scaffold2866_cov148-Isochrysis_galbana.AAC.16
MIRGMRVLWLLRGVGGGKRNKCTAPERNSTPHPSAQPPASAAARPRARRPHGQRSRQTAKSREREPGRSRVPPHVCARAHAARAQLHLLELHICRRGPSRHQTAHAGGAHTSTRLRSCSVGACSNEALEARLAVRGVCLYGSKIFPGHRALVLAGDARHRAKVPGWIAGGRCGDGEIVGYP